MKIIVPAKASSKRIPQKNFIEFSNNKSLLEICIDKLAKVKDKKDIFVSCEDEEKRDKIESLGVNFLLRDSQYCDNDCSLYDWFNSTVNQIPGDEDIAWCQLCDPLFNEYKECFDMWEKVKSKHDCLVVAYPEKRYILDSEKKPIGWGFGKDHIKSQNLPVIYAFHWTISILTRKCVLEHGYYIGGNPFWYESHSQHIDIDTKEDFKKASALYSLL